MNITTDQYVNDYLLQSRLGKTLFHDVAKDLPIIDYHNHLNPAHLASNKQFDNIVEAWVMFDPYKHRAMRICGVPEREITGDATPKEKFMAWAKTLPKTLGNPLHIWSYMELQSVFGISQPLNELSAEEIWNQCNDDLQSPGYGMTDILKSFKTSIVCTSDDMLDNIELHQQASKTQGIGVFPSLRGDAAIAFDMPVQPLWQNKLSDLSGMPIDNIEGFKNAISKRLNAFEKAGCKLADHSLDSGFKFVRVDEKQAEVLFNKWKSGQALEANEVNKLKTHFLLFLGKAYATKGWAMQLHIGAQRYTSSRLRQLAGPAGGYASLGQTCDIDGLAGFLDDLEKDNSLPRTILYTLNPADNEVLASLTGSFAEDGVAGKVQFGPAWWYNDHYHGIRLHLANIAGYGLLSQFIGMTTDSRSVFSFSRHEYFRRILCEQISQWVGEGIMPNDETLLTNLVSNICYHNSYKWIFNEQRAKQY